ncbi:Pol protein [Phytophthora palmivora]|uniref:Pol protein n=1 Tax=Phytophthora palmivora TaxID=4796 RepID=A0A2P4WZ97_9STRA|nr:Pol protein [Phytophthora palmivora]
MPQGLSNAPATFNRLVTQLFRPLRTFAQTYFDDIFVHSRAEGGQTAMEVHLKHLRRVFEVMRANKLYASIDKCVFAAEEIKILGRFVCRVGVRVSGWGYAELARPLSDLLKKDADWVWERQHQDAFDSIKASLQQAPALKQVIQRLQAAESCRTEYPVHGKKQLAMKYALAKFSVYILGSSPFVIYTDHASLRTATSSPHLSQQMVRWLSFFAEYNFRVEYKPGKLNVLADALSRRPDMSVGSRQICTIGYA